MPKGSLLTFYIVRAFRLKIRGTSQHEILDKPVNPRVNELLGLNMHVMIIRERGVRSHQAIRLSVNPQVSLYDV